MIMANIVVLAVRNSFCYLLRTREFNELELLSLANSLVIPFLVGFKFFSYCFSLIYVPSNYSNYINRMYCKFYVLL